MLNGEAVGSLDATEDNTLRTLSVPLVPMAGESELTLVITASESLEIYDITLF